MATDELIRFKGVCSYILFNKNNFVIAKMKVIDGNKTLPSNLTIKGGGIFVEKGKTYTIDAKKDEKAKYDDTYEAVRVAMDMDLSPENKASVRAFLEAILPKQRANALIEAVEDPIKALEEEDYELLCSVKGIGQSTADKMIGAYNAQKDLTVAYVGLKDFGLTREAIIKICKHFGSPELAVKEITDNPYKLVGVSGYGFSKADSVFLSLEENSPTDHRRVEAYINFMFTKEEEEGHTWVSPREFVDKLKTFIPEADERYGAKYVMESPDFVVKDVDGVKRISSAKMYKIEEEIVKHLKRLMSVPTTMKLDGYEKSVEATEKMNGWEYSDEQRKAIDEMINRNVYMLQGLAGTGKSTTVKALLNAVESFGYTYSQCALSGKASNNLSLVTGKEGNTIHRLLGSKGGSGGYIHDEKNKLDANVVVLDELSMVDARLFLDLIRAIPTGGKLIMLGDFGQLEAIGVGIMGSLIKSRVVPMSILKKVHRQAAASAIITHSISVRNGIKPEGLKLTENGIYGEKQDLEYIFVDDNKEREIFKETMAKFRLAITSFNIEDIQIICSTKSTGAVSTAELNRAAQMLYNPADALSETVTFERKDGSGYELRVKDKVINMKNNKNTLSPDGKTVPIFNGNTGIIIDITTDNDGNKQATINFDGIGEVVVGGQALDSIELGYAITVHKSQGSTIKYVLFALPFHYLLNTKELIYTGMTRASDYQVLVTSKRSFNSAIKKTNVKKKKTNLPDMLIEAFKDMA